MPKLLVVATIEKTISEFFLPYGDYFRTKGWQVDCISNFNYDPFDECSEHFDHRYCIGWKRNPLNIVNFIEPVRQIRELVLREKYDIVHAHTPVAAFVTRFALRNIRKTHNVKVVYTAHGFHFYKGGNRLKNFVYRTAEKVAARWTDKLVVINGEDYDAARKWLLPPEKIVLMPGIGVDFKKYNTDQIAPEQIEKLRKELGLNTDDLIFLMIAEFVPRKRHADVIRALQFVRTDKVQVVFAGDGPLMSNIKEMAKKLCVENRVHFIGQRDDIPVLIAASCATVLPSQQEGLPRAIMESMAQRIPVIGTDIRGSRDLLQDGCGIIVPVGEITRLASAIDYLANIDKETKDKMVDTAYKHASRYDIKVIQELHDELYSSLLHYN